MIKIYFATETERLNRMIERGKAMTDIQYIEIEISRWLRSPQRMEMLTGEWYYEGRQDILLRKRMAIVDNGEMQEVKHLPNNRIIDNQYAKCVDQKANYLLGKPLTFDSDDKGYEDALKTVFGKNQQRTLKLVGEDSLNCGIGWIYPYYGEDGTLCLQRFHPWEILPFWSDSEHTVLDCAARIYEMEIYEGRNLKTKQRVELFTKDGIHRYYYDNGALTEDTDHPMESYITVGESGYNWDKIPLIAFKYNAKEIPLIRRVKELQDSINLMISDFANNMQQDVNNTILVIKNYDGTNLGQFRKNLATFGAVKVTDDGDVKTLTVEVNAENYNSILSLLKKSLIENARSYDAKDDRLSGNPNQMNIQSMYSDIDLDASGMETEFQAAFEELLWYVDAYLANTGAGNFEGDDVNVIFNRDILINETDSINNCRSSLGILSNETIVSQHPWISDVKKELQRIQDEQQEQEISPYADAFPRQNGDDVDAE